MEDYRKRDGQSSFADSRFNHLGKLKHQIAFENGVGDYVKKEILRLNESKSQSILRNDGSFTDKEKEVVVDIRKWRLRKKRKELLDEIQLIRSREKNLTKKELETRLRAAQNSLKEVEDSLGGDSFKLKLQLLPSQSGVLVSTSKDTVMNVQKKEREKARLQRAKRDEARLKREKEKFEEILKREEEEKLLLKEKRREDVVHQLEIAREERHKRSMKAKEFSNITIKKKPLFKEKEENYMKKVVLPELENYQTELKRIKDQSKVIFMFLCLHLPIRESNEQRRFLKTCCLV